MVYCQNFSLNSKHPSDKVRPSVRAIPAINIVACQMCVSATLRQNPCQIRSEARVLELNMISKEKMTSQSKPMHLLNSL